jgi:hypothetical protein
LCGNHPGILAEKGEGLEVVANAIFSRFPNKNPENPTFTKIIFYHGFTQMNTDDKPRNTPNTRNFLQKETKDTKMAQNDE